MSYMVKPNDLPEELTEKQLRFCREYAADPNKTQAYLRAFGRKNISYTNARKAASELFTLPHIQAEIKSARREYMRRVGLDATKVLRGMMEIAFVDQDDCFEPDENNGNLVKPRAWDEIPPATRRAMQGVKVKRKVLKRMGEGSEEVTLELVEVEYKFPDKNSAFDKLCKHLGLTKGELQEALEKFVKTVDLTQETPDDE